MIAERERDVAVMAAIQNKELAADPEPIGFPAWHPGWDQYVLWELRGFRPEAAQALAKRDWRAAPAAFPPGAGEVVEPDRLWMRDGWNVLEIGAKGDAWRWSSGGVSRVRLGAPLAPGRIRISLQGSRLPYPQPEATLWVGMEGEPARAPLKLGPGWFDAQVELTLAHAHAKPVLTLEHPRFRITEFQPDNPDDRPLGFLLHGLAVGKAG
jgi:hypothetical protein